MTKRRSREMTCVALSIASILAIPAPSLAADINVGIGGCTLVDAVLAAENDAAQGNCSGGMSNDRILLQPNSTITLTQPDPGNSGLSSDTGLPPITTGITIEGRNSTLTRSAGADPFRFFYVDNGGDLTINDLTITNASTTGSGGVILAEPFSNVSINGSTFSSNRANVGGAIHAPGNVLNEDPSGTISLTNSQVTGNSAQYSGGISIGGGALRTLTVSNSGISGNTAYLGGGISTVRGHIVIGNSTMTNNRATDGSAGSGGAINCYAGSLTLTDSTLSGNYAFDGGGAINCSMSSDIDIESSTISGNSANLGGGINVTKIGNNPDPGTYLKLSNSTVTNNTSFFAGGGIAVYNTSSANLINSTLSDNSAGVYGGGVAANNAEVSLTNSIIANSANNDDVLLTAGATLNSDTASILEEGSFGGSRTGDPGLLPLSDNGGPTKTHALKANSIARNTAVRATCTLRDQRNQLRKDGDLDCDVGAIEFNSNDLDDDGFIIIPLGNGKTAVIPN